MEPSTSAAPGMPPDPRNRQEPPKEEGEPPSENLPLLPKRVPPLGYTPPPRTESEKQPPEKQNGLDPKRPASEGGLPPPKAPHPRNRFQNYWGWFLGKTPLKNPGSPRIPGNQEPNLNGEEKVDPSSQEPDEDADLIFDDAVQEMEPVSTQEQDQGESCTGNLIGDTMGRGMSVLDSDVFESPSNAAVLNPETSSFRKQKDQEFAISLKHIMWANSRGEPLRQNGYRSDPQEVSHPMDGKTVPPRVRCFPLATLQTCFRKSSKGFNFGTASPQKYRRPRWAAGNRRIIGNEDHYSPR